MVPERINTIGASLDLDMPTVVRSTQIDDGAFKGALVVRLPVLWERTSRRSGFHAWCRPVAHGARVDRWIPTCNQYSTDTCPSWCSW
jgi:hypothetical protein